ncbi:TRANSMEMBRANE EMP24 DOMAIN-CONTAINING PROTEIN [Salix koriyanagi]|uniref:TRANSMEMBRANE EMP24 DOMAIN-CONTAINING PROTEIN n=1 Tax=Salix koriyanagi TaxID=2511006 RepID=A0A9Q0VQF3_9ROSI|nr:TRANSMEMBRANE EMP24 DOMAIN-CONTAINING PROTEIN [Salix koriyanagi]
MSKSNLLMITTLGLVLTIVESMRFDLQSGHTKCISEDINSSAISVGKYNAVNPNEGFPLPDTHKINVRVTSPYGNNYHHVDQVDSGNFAFTAAEAGDYTTCFTALEHKPETTVAIEFEWKTGVAAKDWSKIAKKEKVEVSDCFGMYLLFNLTFYDNLFIKSTPVFATEIFFFCFAE